MATQRISARQPSGEILVLEVTPETTGKELKQQIKERKPWDKLTRSTTGVEVIVGDNQLLANDATVLEAGIAEDTVVSVVFNPNKVICSNKDAITSLGGIVDSELLLVIEIPDNETQIHQNAFNNCHTLATVTIPDSVTHIGKNAFAWCGSLVEIPDNETQIHQHAFEFCQTLAKVTIPDTVTYIGNRAFANCSSLASLTIPDSVTHIGDGAFFGCSSLVNLTILDSVTNIGNGAFFGCSSLVNLTIPNSVTHIGDVAFFGSSSLVNLTISNSVTHIGNSAFQRCCSLASLIIPDSVTHIGDDAFAECSSLELRVSVPGTRFEMYKLQGCQRIVATGCHCGQCQYTWFLKGWVCPQHRCHRHHQSSKHDRQG